MKKNSRYHFVLINFGLIILLSIFIPIGQAVNAANDVTKDISYEFVVDSKDYDYSGYVFSAKKN
ncbi:Uncharacterised protein [Actinobacillus pleuropneumoniae]|nr:Uncharacterised protein [Actinobacillus pleuropneumoniae]